jgi:anaerobic ribonucleoside-triphosphate reductase activating protein
VAARVVATRVEGPHLRYALWVQGCTLACPGCCNPRMFDPGLGATMSVATLAEELDAARRDHGVEGLTVVGGEPLQQLGAVTALATAAERLGVGVLVFTGYTAREALARPGFAELWRRLDTLVTGRYDRTRPEPADGRRFIGSTNQRRWHRTDRYRDAQLWRGVAGAEVHFDPDGRPQVIGNPVATRPVVAALRRRRP